MLCVVCEVAAVELLQDCWGIFAPDLLRPPDASRDSEDMGTPQDGKAHWELNSLPARNQPKVWARKATLRLWFGLSPDHPCEGWGHLWITPLISHPHTEQNSISISFLNYLGELII
jgi:hypothetical protein